VVEFQALCNAQQHYSQQNHTVRNSELVSSPNSQSEGTEFDSRSAPHARAPQGHYPFGVDEYIPTIRLKLIYL